MARVVATFGKDEYERLAKLAKREHRDVPRQLEYMVMVMADVFATLPDYMFREEQTETLVTILRDAISGECAQTVITLQQEIRELRERLGDVLAVAGGQST